MNYEFRVMSNEIKNESIIAKKAYAFAIDIVKLYKNLTIDNKEFVLSKQLLRSGTSIGANVFESQHAESKADFIHKMKIAIKESNETLYWLLVCEKCGSYPSGVDLKNAVEELIRIISKIIYSSKLKTNSNNG